MPHPDVPVIAEKFSSLEPVLNERARRLWAAAEAHAIGRGGISRVAEATGLSRITIRSGLSELYGSPPTDGRVEDTRRTRRHGGGRKPLTEHDPKLERALEVLVDPVTRGDPMSPLRWTCKSAANLAAELHAQGHPVSERSVNRLLHASGYSLQSNRKTIEGGDHPDRDAQFRHINRRVKAYQKRGQPAEAWRRPVDPEVIGDIDSGRIGSPPTNHRYQREKPSRCHASPDAQDLLEEGEACSTSRAAREVQRGAGRHSGPDGGGRGIAEDPVGAAGSQHHRTGAKYQRAHRPVDRAGPRGLP